MLVWSIGECTVSIIKINNNIKEPTHGYHNYNTNQILIFGKQLKIRDCFFYLDGCHSKPY